ncbi:MAG: DUF1858 domain-containing protein [Candidatus Kapabacteria bacterium]|nr:DUF1858 domain-containing protein [Candidatus Kapabacteria bacterium]
MKSRIERTTTIEELTEILPSSVSYMMEKGIRCLICGEPIWGTIEEVVFGKGFSENELQQILKDLNSLFEKSSTLTNN